MDVERENLVCVRIFKVNLTPLHYRILFGLETHTQSTDGHKRKHTYTHTTAAD